MNTKNLLSFDVEEYFHGLAYSHIPNSKWDSLESRIIENMEKLLLILEDRKATFFVLGWIADKYPHLLKTLHEQGHEIGCHSDIHKSIWDLSPKEFKEDTICAKKRIEDTIGSGILGFRAPTFSVTKETYWALEIIRDVGFKYDSSIFPIHHDRYGIPDSPREPYKINGLWEIPLSTARFFGANIPFGGGGYFRLYPYWLTRIFIKTHNRNGIPFVFYQHPWELDSNVTTKPKSFLSWLRRNLVTGNTENKLRKMIPQYEFQTIRDWLEEHDNEGAQISTG